MQLRAVYTTQSLTDLLIPSNFKSQFKPYYLHQCQSADSPKLGDSIVVVICDKKTGGEENKKSKRTNKKTKREKRKKDREIV